MRLLLCSLLLSIFLIACADDPAIVEVGKDNVVIKYSGEQMKVSKENFVIIGYENIPTPTPIPTPTRVVPQTPSTRPTAIPGYQTPEYSDREILVALYNATDGENWTTKANWVTAAPIGSWEGVTVNVHGRVNSLVLRGLKGSFPSEVGNLFYLHTLDLSGGSLSGEIPEEIGQLMNLRTLYLDRNDLSGEIPEELGQLVKLEVLDLGNNNLDGMIPSEMGELSKLWALILHNNLLDGIESLELEHFPKLVNIHLAGNELTGCLPVVLAGVTVNDFHLFSLPWCTVQDE